MPGLPDNNTGKRADWDKEGWFSNMRFAAYAGTAAFPYKRKQAKDAVVCFPVWFFFAERRLFDCLCTPLACFFIGNCCPVHAKKEALYKIFSSERLWMYIGVIKKSLIFPAEGWKKISKDSGFCLILGEKLEITYQRIKEFRAGSIEWLHDRIVISIFISNFSVMFS